MQMISISFTEQGSRLNAELIGRLNRQGYFCTGYAVERFAEQYGLLSTEPDLQAWIGKLWGKASFLFIGAAGIAVRMTAPWVTDKYKDSAVICMDEKGRFVIPLLSGHVGSGVELAEAIASCMGAVPVITTATDVQGKFAVDVFARKNNLYIAEREIAKRISALILEGKPVGFFSAFPVHGELPQGLVQCKAWEQLVRYPGGIAVADAPEFIKESAAVDAGNIQQENRLAADLSRKNILHLIPRTLVLGIGCRKGIAGEHLLTGVDKILQEQKRCREQVLAIASIDLKKEEAGLQKLAWELGVPFVTYSAGELEQVSLVSSRSFFVKQVTGVDNVCERAAALYDPGGRLLQPKKCLDGMTVAVREKEVEIRF